jgi:hypothetical protein
VNDRDAIERELLDGLEDWQGFLGRQTVWSRQILTRMLAGRVLFTPTTINDSGVAGYAIRVPLTYERLFAGSLYPQGMASPAGTDTLWTFERRRLVRAA